MPAFAPVPSPGLPIFDGVMDGDEVFPTGFEEVVVVELLVAGLGKI
jgi:hypothetical protein